MAKHQWQAHSAEAEMGRQHCLFLHLLQDTELRGAGHLTGLTPSNGMRPACRNYRTTPRTPSCLYQQLRN